MIILGNTCCCVVSWLEKKREPVDGNQLPHTHQAFPCQSKPTKYDCSFWLQYQSRLNLQPFRTLFDLFPFKTNEIFGFEKENNALFFGCVRNCARAYSSNLMPWRRTKNHYFVNYKYKTITIRINLGSKIFTEKAFFAANWRSFWKA